jgi:hypothetical protein|tara:strand:- start:60 stop:233 length:174 start_codon:yes stop_codon:yes gene_type:complete
MTNKKAPQIGDKIVHNERGHGGTNEGKVIELLAMQFVYETDEGQTRFCFYREDWRNI